MTPIPETPSSILPLRWVPQSLVAALLTVTSFAMPWWLASFEPSVVVPPTLAATEERPPVVFSLRATDPDPQAEASATPAEAASLTASHQERSAPDPPLAPEQESEPAPLPGPGGPAGSSLADAVSGAPTPSPHLPVVTPATVLLESGPRRRLARKASRRSRRTRAAGVPSRPAKQRSRRTPPCPAPDHPDIATVGTDRYRIDRDLVDHYTGNLREAARLAHVAWHRREDGKVDGFRIRRIRCGSVLHEAGFRNGDVVHAVNGRPVRNLAQALGAYRRLRKKRKLWLEVTRKGDTRTLRYTLS